MQRVTECELIGPTLPAQEVADPLSSQPIISESLETFTSLLHTTLDGFHFIFAGTDGGELFQVWDIVVITDLLERVFEVLRVVLTVAVAIHYAVMSTYTTKIITAHLTHFIPKGFVVITTMYGVQNHRSRLER